MPRQTNPIETLKGLAESGRRIRLAPGVVGKTSHTFLGLLALWGIVLWKLTPSEPWFSAALIGVGLVMTWVFHRWSQQMQQFAKENPDLALMEGADITEYKKFEARIKGRKKIEPSPLTADRDPPPAIALDPSERDQ